MGDRSKKLTRQQRRAVERKEHAPSPPPSSVSTTSFREFSLEWRYPLPPPGLLQQYGFIKQGPDRLLKLWERQAKHRQKLENRDSWTEAFQRIFGSIAGFVMGIAGLAGGFYLILQGKEVSGFISLLFPLSILLSVIQRTKPPENPDASARDDPGTSQVETEQLPLRLSE
jgi:uncharacterized membrane protein